MPTSSQFFGGPETIDFFSTAPIIISTTGTTPVQMGSVAMLAGASMQVEPVFGPVGLPVMMILTGGPLDGESQIVEGLPTTIGSELTFNLPNFQTFDPEAEDEVVLAQGLQADYVLLRRGPDPQAGDNWSSSWVFGFTGESFIPTPSTPATPPPSQPVALTQVWMSATSTLVPDTLPIVTTPAPTTVTMSAETTMEVDTTPTEAGIVEMIGESVMTVQPDWSPEVHMSSQASMTVIGFTPPYDQLILADAPYAYWKLDELTGAVAMDSSGNGHTGNVTGGVVLGQPGPINADPLAFTFDGNTGVVYQSDSAVAYPNPFSVEAWYKGSGVNQGIVGMHSEQTVNDTVGSFDHSMYMDMNGRLTGDIFNVSRPFDPTPTNDGNWHHAVLTWDGTTLLLYRDGHVVGTPGTGAATGPFAGWWKIGFTPLPGRSLGWFNGSISHVAVYTTVLAAADILTHYNASTH